MEYLTTSNEKFEKELEKITEFKFQKIKLTSERKLFNLIRLNVQKYCLEGVALIGDAAHTIHPLAGQGLNISFSDIQELAFVLKKSKNHNRQLHTLNNLMQYERMRRLQNDMMFYGMEGLRNIFCNKNFLLKTLRGNSMNFFNSSNFLKGILAKFVMGKI